MIEILVAVGIILILLAIAIPATMGILKSKKEEATRATLNTLENAIRMFADEAPLGNVRFTTDPTHLSSKELFGNWPPYPDGQPYTPFTNMMKGYFDETSAYDLGDYATIESFVFFLSQFCIPARDILAQLPDTIHTNKDGDGMVYDGREVALFEISDAWGRPLRYSVELFPLGDNKYDSNRHRWELRSAGNDGLFDPAFSENSASDDVVQRSDWSTWR